MRFGCLPLRARIKGITLLEILVALSLFLLFGVLLVQVLGPTFQAAGRNAHRMELQQSAWLALKRISSDLSHASVEGWSYKSDTSSAALGIHRIDGLTAQGRRAWESEIRVYTWSANLQKLFSHRWPPGPPSLGLTVPLDRPLALTDAQLDLFSNLNSNRARVLAKHAREFSISQAAAPASQPLRIRLLLVREEAGFKEDQRFEIVRDVLTRN